MAIIRSSFRIPPNTHLAGTSTVLYAYRSYGCLYHCTRALHDTLKSPSSSPLIPPAGKQSLLPSQSARWTNRRAARYSDRSVGWMVQGNTAVPVPHSRIQVERELAPRWRTLHYCPLALLLLVRRRYRFTFLPEALGDDSELRVERPNTRLEQSSGSRGDRVSRPSPPDCTHLGTQGRRPCYTRHGQTYG